MVVVAVYMEWEKDNSKCWVGGAVYNNVRVGEGHWLAGLVLAFLRKIRSHRISLLLRSPLDAVKQLGSWTSMHADACQLAVNVPASALTSMRDH